MAPFALRPLQRPPPSRITSAIPQLRHATRRRRPPQPPPLPPPPPPPSPRPRRRDLPCNNCTTSFTRPIRCLAAWSRCSRPSSPASLRSTCRGTKSTQWGTVPASRSSNSFSPTRRYSPRRRGAVDPRRQVRQTLAVQCRNSGVCFPLYASAGHFLLSLSKVYIPITRGHHQVLVLRVWPHFINIPFAFLTMVCNGASISQSLPKVVI